MILYYNICSYVISYNHIPIDISVVSGVCEVKVEWDSHS